MINICRRWKWGGGTGVEKVREREEEQEEQVMTVEKIWRGGWEDGMVEWE